MGVRAGRRTFTAKLNAGDCKCPSRVTGAAAFLANETKTPRRGLGLTGDGEVGYEG